MGTAGLVGVAIFEGGVPSARRFEPGFVVASKYIMYSSNAPIAAESAVSTGSLDAPRGATLPEELTAGKLC